MFAMFKALFSMFTNGFSAGAKATNALNILATGLEDTANVYAKEQAHELKKRTIELDREIAALEAEKQSVKQIEAA